MLSMVSPPILMIVKRGVVGVLPRYAMLASRGS